MRKFLKLLYKEFSGILAAIAAILLGCLLLPLGVVYTFSKPFYDHRGKPLSSRLLKILSWCLNVLYQIWVVITSGFYYIGLIIDLLGNVLVGELIEDIITTKEDTMFGKGKNTISVSVGDLERDKVLNKTGRWFSKILSIFETNHCSKAIRLWDFKQKLKSE